MICFNQTQVRRQRGRFSDTKTNTFTASSFNMPFTTMSNYNWLFDAPVEVNVDINAKTRGLDMLSSSIKLPNGFNDVNDQQIMTGHFTPPNTLADFELPRSNDSMGWDALVHESTFFQPHTVPGGQVRNRPASGRHSQSSWISNNPVSTHRRPTSYEPPLDTSTLTKSSSNTARRIPSREFKAPEQQMIYPRENTSRTHLSTSTTSLCPTPNMPTMDNDSRGRILDLLIAARPLMPSNIDVRADNPLLCLSSMQSCLDLFFSRFNVVYPLLHKPTFEPAKTETFLLLAILLLGATYSDKEMHMLAVCIHDTLRAQIFQDPAFTAQPELWILQTMLLVECFGKSRAGQKQHDMSHLFHGLLIK